MATIDTVAAQLTNMQVYIDSIVSLLEEVKGTSFSSEDTLHAISDQIDTVHDAVTIPNVGSIYPMAIGMSVPDGTDSALTLKAGDTSPALLVQVLDARRKPVNVTDADAVFTMVNESGEVVLDQETATIVSGPNGQVAYTWTDGDTDTAGSYRAEFTITVDGNVFTVPNQGTISVIIEPRLHIDEPVPAEP